MPGWMFTLVTGPALSHTTEASDGPVFLGPSWHPLLFSSTRRGHRCPFVSTCCAADLSFLLVPRGGKLFHALLGDIRSLACSHLLSGYR